MENMKIYVKDHEDEAVCGQTVVGETAKINEYADTLMALSLSPSVAGKLVISLRHHGHGVSSPVEYTVQVETVSEITFAERRESLHFTQRFDKMLFARFDPLFASPGFEIEIESDTEWPRHLFVYNENGSLYLYVGKGVDRNAPPGVKFRVANRRSGLKSASVVLMTSYAPALLTAQTDEVVPFLVIILVVLCLLIVLLCFSGGPQGPLRAAEGGFGQSATKGVADEKRTVTSCSTADEDEREVNDQSSWRPAVSADDFDIRMARFCQISDTVVLRPAECRVGGRLSS